jgi:hypothetical protein
MSNERVDEMKLLASIPFLPLTKFFGLKGGTIYAMASCGHACKQLLMGKKPLYNGFTNDVLDLAAEIDYKLSDVPGYA